jgi:hypothetical protein
MTSVPPYMTRNLDIVPLTILERLVTVPDYHQSQLFTHAQGISNKTIELQTVNTNFKIAMKWARIYTTHMLEIINLDVEQIPVVSEYRLFL